MSIKYLHFILRHSLMECKSFLLMIFFQTLYLFWYIKKGVNVNRWYIVFTEKFNLNFYPKAANALSEQIPDHQSLNDHDIPDSVWHNGCSMDQTMINNTELIFYGVTLIKWNTVLGSQIYIWPHSNASEERLLRKVCAKKTTFRASMGFNTLSSILTVK